MLPAQAHVAAYDLLLLELRARLERTPEHIIAQLVDIGDELVESHQLRGSDARRVVAAVQFDLREAARHWLGLSDAVIDWSSYPLEPIEHCLKEHLAGTKDESWAALAPFQIALPSIGTTLRRCLNCHLTGTYL
jgi:hypothetical protein